MPRPRAAKTGSQPRNAITSVYIQKAQALAAKNWPVSNTIAEPAKPAQPAESANPAEPAKVDTLGSKLSSNSTRDSNPAEQGTELVGRYIKQRFPGFGTHIGKVIDISAFNMLTVEYDDGDERELTVSQVRKWLLPLDASVTIEVFDSLECNRDDSHTTNTSTDEKIARELQDEELARNLQAQLDNPTNDSHARVSLRPGTQRIGQRKSADDSQMPGQYPKRTRAPATSSDSMNQSLPQKIRQQSSTSIGAPLDSVTELPLVAATKRWYVKCQPKKTKSTARTHRTRTQLLQIACQEQGLWAGGEIVDMCERLARMELGLPPTALEQAHATFKSNQVVRLLFDDGSWHGGTISRVDKLTLDVVFEDTVDFKGAIPASALSQFARDGEFLKGFELQLVFEDFINSEILIVSNGDAIASTGAQEGKQQEPATKQVEPTDQEILAHLRQILMTTDLQSSSCRSVRRELGDRFGESVIHVRKQWIKAQIRLMVDSISDVAYTTVAGDKLLEPANVVAEQLGKQPALSPPQLAVVAVSHAQAVEASAGDAHTRSFAAAASTAAATAASSVTFDREAMAMCSICLEDIDQLPPDTAMTVFRCGHIFCVGCIEQWFNYGNKSCPNCKTGYSSLRHAETTTAQEMIQAAALGSAQWYGK